MVQLDKRGSPPAGQIRSDGVNRIDRKYENI